MVTLSTIMLILLQHNVAHLGIATGLCLSEAATKHLPSWLSRPLLSSAVLAAISTAGGNTRCSHRFEYALRSQHPRRRDTLHPWSFIHAGHQLLPAAGKVDYRLCFHYRSVFSL